MSLIKKSNELVIPTTVKMMIYGQAGMGKSTVALSAPKPLLLDFDNGVKRMNMAHLENIDTVQVTFMERCSASSSRGLVRLSDHCSRYHRQDDGLHHYSQVWNPPAVHP